MSPFARLRGVGSSKSYCCRVECRGFFVAGRVASSLDASNQGRDDGLTDEYSLGSKSSHLPTLVQCPHISAGVFFRPSPKWNEKRKYPRRATTRKCGTSPSRKLSKCPLHP